MARGVSFSELVTKLRIAARYDPNPALSKSVVPLFEQTLKDTQERLYDEFDWPFLKVQRDKVLAAGERYYDVPADINLERIIAVDVLVGGLWEPVERGISLDHYNACNSDSGARRDPVCRWDVVDTGNGEQIEVWPVPASNGGKLRFSGIRKLKPLVNEGDRADLDDQIIIGFAAAELLAGKGQADDAKVKMQQANRRVELLHGRVTKRRNNGFVLGGSCHEEERDRRRPVAIVSTQQP